MELIQWSHARYIPKTPSNLHVDMHDIYKSFVQLKPVPSTSTPGAFYTHSSTHLHSPLPLILKSCDR